MFYPDETNARPQLGRTLGDVRTRERRDHRERPRAGLLTRLFCCQLLLILTSVTDPLRGQGIPENQPDIGQRAPDFELPLVGQKMFLSLRDEYRNGPVVVIVLRGYPGYQCPNCKNQFNAVVNRAKALSLESKCVVLVYPGNAEQLEKHSKHFLGSRKLPHPIKVVRDGDMQMVEEHLNRFLWPRSGRIRLSNRANQKKMLLVETI